MMSRCSCIAAIDELPEDKPQDARSACTRPATVLAGKKVLIVDDDIRNIFAMTSILEPYKMQIVSAETGKAAIEIAAADTRTSTWC